MVENIFKYAVENKLRFPFRGIVTVEDLFDMSVNDLDTVYKTLNAQIKKANEESLLSEKTSEDEELEVKIEIVKNIFAQKISEKEAREKAREIREKKQRILEIMANKKDEELQNKSVDELQKMLDELSN
jgi:hypothetical protein